jgi:hypothetical protein
MLRLLESVMKCRIRSGGDDQRRNHIVATSTSQPRPQRAVALRIAWSLFAGGPRDHDVVQLLRDGQERQFIDIISNIAHAFSSDGIRTKIEPRNPAAAPDLACLQG